MTDAMFAWLRGVLNRKIIGPLRFWQTLFLPVAVVFLVTSTALRIHLAKITLLNQAVLTVANLLTSILTATGFAIFSITILLVFIGRPMFKLLRRYFYLPVLRPTQNPFDTKRALWIFFSTALFLGLVVFAIVHRGERWGQRAGLTGLVVLTGFAVTYLLEGNKLSGIESWLPVSVNSDGTIKTPAGEPLWMAVLGQRPMNVYADTPPLVGVQRGFLEMVSILSEYRSRAHLIMGPFAPPQSRLNDQGRIIASLVLLPATEGLWREVNAALESTPLRLSRMSGSHVYSYFGHQIVGTALFDPSYWERQDLPKEFKVSRLLPDRITLGNWVSLPEKYIFLLKVTVQSASDLSTLLEICVKNDALLHLLLQPIPYAQSLAFAKGSGDKAKRALLEENPLLREMHLEVLVEVPGPDLEGCQRRVQEIIRSLNEARIDVSQMGGNFFAAQELIDAFQNVLPNLPDRQPMTWLDWLFGGGLFNYLFGKECPPVYTSLVLAQGREDSSGQIIKLLSLLERGTQTALIKGARHYLGTVVDSRGTEFAGGVDLFRLPHHVFISGYQGKGKTSALLNLVNEVAADAVRVVIDLRTGMAYWQYAASVLAPNQNSIIWLPHDWPKEGPQSSFDHVKTSPKARALYQELRETFDRARPGDLFVVTAPPGVEVATNPGLMIVFRALLDCMTGTHKLFFLGVDEAHHLWEKIKGQAQDFQAESARALVDLINEARTGGGEGAGTKVALVSPSTPRRNNPLEGAIHDYFGLRIHMGGDVSDLMKHFDYRGAVVESILQANRKERGWGTIVIPSAFEQATIRIDLAPLLLEIAEEGQKATYEGLPRLIG